MKVFDTMRYLSGIGIGVPSAEHQAAMKQKSRLISTLPSNVPVLPPPLHESQEAQEELRQVMKRQKEPFDAAFARRADIDDSGMMKELANKFGYDASEIVNAVYSDTEPFILGMKYRYRRPRPKELSFMYGLQFEQRQSRTAGTPSYPSGHAFQSRLVAEVLASYIPSGANEFRALADKIAESRIWLGVHYPTDIEYGKYLAQSVAPEVISNLRAEEIDMFI